jgi:hypothetical protein
MSKIHDTVSLCDHCYRHIPSEVYDHEGKVWIKKVCPEHGEMTGLVEEDLDFYHSLNYNSVNSFNQILFEATDRCQLACPHCYHLPDNKTQDRPIQDILSQLDKFPRHMNPMLAGAEATLRPDFVELCQEIHKMDFNRFEVLTNGLRFADEDFTKSVKAAGLTELCLGLNHPSYQGKKIHTKQLKALDNVLNYGYEVGYVGYTLKSFNELPFILDEIQKINHPRIHHYRIRCGAFIGRSSDEKRSYLSSLIKHIKTLADVKSCPGWDDNIYHIMVEINGIKVRLIQWPDVTNIDMEELATGPWSQFYDGPITNFVHQVITRDAFKNKGLPMLDLVPEKYRYKEITARNVIPIKRII